MNRKKIASLLLVMVLVVASMSVVYAGSYSWEDDWNSSIASAWGEANCYVRSADATTYCLELISGVTISTTATVDATYQYKMPNTTNYFTQSDYDTDGTMAEVYFSCDEGYISMFIDYFYTASYTAYGSHGEAYTESYSNSRTVNY